MAAKRIHWSAQPHTRLIAEQVYLLHCPRGFASLCELAGRPELLLITDDHGTALNAAITPVLEEAREVENESTGRWLDLILEVSESKEAQSLRTRILDLGRKLGLLGTLDLPLKSLSFRQRVVWTAILTSQLKEARFTLLALSSRLHPETERDSLALRSQLQQLATLQSSTFLLATIDRGDYPGWDILEFRGYLRSESPLDDTLTDDSTEVDDAA